MTRHHRQVEVDRNHTSLRFASPLSLYTIIINPKLVIRQLCANDRFGLNIVRSPPSCIRSSLMQRGRESLPIYNINKVYLPFSASLLSLLHPFFVIFLNFLSCFFAGLRKSLTFALAKRERLLLYGGVGFLAQMKKEFFERFS